MKILKNLFNYCPTYNEFYCFFYCPTYCLSKNLAKNKKLLFKK